MVIVIVYVFQLISFSIVFIKLNCSPGFPVIIQAVAKHHISIHIFNSMKYNIILLYIGYTFYPGLKIPAYSDGKYISNGLTSFGNSAVYPPFSICQPVKVIYRITQADDAIQ